VEEWKTADSRLHRKHPTRASLDVWMDKQCARAQDEHTAKDKALVGTPGDINRMDSPEALAEAMKGSPLTDGAGAGAMEADSGGGGGIGGDEGTRTERCAYCHTAATELCGRCKKACYCGPQCQKKAWPKHKHECQQHGEKAHRVGKESESRKMSTAEMVDLALAQQKAQDELQACALQGSVQDAVHGPCAQCRISAGILRCARCKVPWYCGQQCQKKAWPAHKGTCQLGVPPQHKEGCKLSEDATVNLVFVQQKAQHADSEVGQECPICLDCILVADGLALGCGHHFHRCCVSGLRKFGVNETCPLCRAELPPGAAQYRAEAAAVLV
jgi:hypothetical protein